LWIVLAVDQLKEIRIYGYRKNLTTLGCGIVGTKDTEVLKVGNIAFNPDWWSIYNAIVFIDIETFYDARAEPW
jgi:hypothetical protein